MTTVLVTGGAGYIGSHMCKALAARGLVPVCFDNLSTGWRAAVRFGPLVEGDLLDREALDAAMKQHRPSAVVHFAARSSVAESMSRPDLYYETNVSGTINLLNAMQNAGIAHIINSSTAAVYGEPQGMPIRESEPANPINPYGASKLTVERVLRDYDTAFGIHSVSLRYFNVSGADEEAEVGECHVPETHLVPLLLDVAQGKRAEATIFGTDYDTPDGTCIRDYVHVQDLIDGHLLALDALRGGANTMICNLGTGHGFSVREVIDAVTKVTGRTMPVVEAERRHGDPTALVCDPGLAEKKLDWSRPRSNLDRIVTDAWRWHRSGGIAAFSQVDQRD